MYIALTDAVSMAAGRGIGPLAQLYGAHWGFLSLDTEMHKFGGAASSGLCDGLVGAAVTIHAQARALFNLADGMSGWAVDPDVAKLPKRPSMMATAAPAPIGQGAYLIERVSNRELMAIGLLNESTTSRLHPGDDFMVWGEGYHVLHKTLDLDRDTTYVVVSRAMGRQLDDMRLEARCADETRGLPADAWSEEPDSAESKGE